MSELNIKDQTFNSRLLLGTGKFGRYDLMEAAIHASATELVTVALKRIETPGQGISESKKEKQIIDYLGRPKVALLPNTSGARSAPEAILAAELAREALETNWIKLEIHPDPRYLMPDPIETLKATEVLAAKGFVVLPYIHADPVLCKRLEDAGTAAVMPLGSPIGSNQGLKTAAFLSIIIEQSRVPVIVDAGIGLPSHAAQAMEMGADAVLVNTAIATAADPVRMARAFRLAVEAGRAGYEAIGNNGQSAVAGSDDRQPMATASSPLTAFLDTYES